MNLQPPVSVRPDAPITGLHRAGVSVPRRWLIAAGAVVVWLALVAASMPLWRYGFGFNAGEAWAMSVGLMAYLALGAGLMTLLITAFAREERNTPHR